eukprot:SAG31_NODE_1675_length_7552_cov_69.287228_6_plen_102_part_00
MLRRCDGPELMRKLRIDLDNVVDTVAIWKEAIPVFAEGSMLSPASVVLMLQIMNALLNPEDNIVAQVVSMLPPPKQLAMLGVVNVPEFNMVRNLHPFLLLV